MLAKPFLLTLVLLQPGLAQKFEVASIRASQFQSADGEGGQREGVEVSGDRLTMGNMTLRSCIAWAYDLQDFQIAGNLGPDRFDIAAKAAVPSTTPILRAMMGALLADRFKLTFHWEAKQVAALDLVAAKGGSMLRISQEDAPGILRPTKGAVVAQHATMAEFVSTLSGPLRTPVVDKTGLAGRFDFTVDLSSYFPDGRGGEQPDITGIVMAALRDQLGLNLESRKEPVQILVIDRIERTPSQN